MRIGRPETRAPGGTEHVERRYRLFVALSLGVTLWGLFPFPLGGLLRSFTVIAPAWVWLVLFVYGLFVFRLSALWLLLELPFVTAWYWILMICAANHSCP